MCAAQRPLRVDSGLPVLNPTLSCCLLSRTILLIVAQIYARGPRSLLLATVWLEYYSMALGYLWRRGLEDIMTDDELHKNSGHVLFI